MKTGHNLLSTSCFPHEPCKVIRFLSLLCLTKKGITARQDQPAITAEKSRNVWMLQRERIKRNICKHHGWNNRASFNPCLKCLMVAFHGFNTRVRTIVPQVSIFFLVQNHLNTRQVCVVGFEKSITADGVLSRAGSNRQSTKIKRRNIILNSIDNFMLNLAVAFLLHAQHPRVQISTKICFALVLCLWTVWRSIPSSA